MAERLSVRSPAASVRMAKMGRACPWALVITSAGGVGADGEDGPRLPVGAGDHHQGVQENRCRDGNIAAALKLPQLLPRFQIVAADVLPPVDHYLPAFGVTGAAAGGVRHDGGGAEGGHIVARRAP